MHRSWILSAVAGLLTAVQAGPAYPRDAAESFQIYAFGDGIGGVPLVSTGSSAYVGNYTLLEDPEAAPVLFTTTSNGAWVGSPNTTESDAPTWSDLRFYVPAASSSSHAIGLVNASSDKTSELRTTGFHFYGTFAYVAGASGRMEMLWFAVPSGTEGLYSLHWNTTVETTDGSIPVTLKSSPPSNS
ncbi:hypothetical protein B0J13DRAFT_617987 [Dactylonectria estremocensis]|uniref:Uncharacterized protein n=1 Tax=Dactylonectria estremocensis TaxID=1079267 RepID=A0A9P9JEW3_9HYPO|nr:hypothetical protein B0J13DRAFT_617987 [Dactylonectria estremocensis]